MENTKMLHGNGKNNEKTQESKVENSIYVFYSQINPLNFSHKGKNWSYTQ